MSILIEDLLDLLEKKRKKNKKKQKGYPTLHKDAKKEREKTISSVIYHFISRHINNLIMSILIIINLSSSTYPLAIRIISIGSICFFV